MTAWIRKQITAKMHLGCGEGASPPEVIVKKSTAGKRGWCEKTAQGWMHRKMPPGSQKSALNGEKGTRGGKAPQGEAPSDKDTKAYPLEVQLGLSSHSSAERGLTVPV